MQAYRDEKMTSFNSGPGPHLVWDRKLSDEEIVSIMNDPYQVFRAYKPPLWERIKAWLRLS